MQEIQQIKEKIEKQKIIELKFENNTIELTFIKIPILIAKLDNDGKIIELTIKTIEGLGEGLSYLILESLDTLPKEGSDEYKTLSTNIKAIHYILSLTALLLNNTSMTNTNLLLSKRRTETTILLNSGENTAVITSKGTLKTEKTVYAITTKDIQKNNEFILTLELIKELLNKGLDMKVLNLSMKTLVENATILQEKLENDVKKKILKNTTKTIIKITLIIVIIWATLKSLGINIPFNNLFTKT